MSGQVTAGDILHAIDGEKVKGNNIDSLRRLIAGPAGTEVKLALISLAGPHSPNAQTRPPPPIRGGGGGDGSDGARSGAIAAGIKTVILVRRLRPPS